MQHGTNHKIELKNPCVASGNGERYIKKIRNNTLIGYKYFSFSGSTEITLTVRGDATGRFDVAVQPDGSIIGSVQVSPEKEWINVHGRAVFTPGVYPLYLRYYGKGIVDMLEITISHYD